MNMKGPSKIKKPKKVTNSWFKEGGVSAQISPIEESNTEKIDALIKRIDKLLD